MPSALLGYLLAGGQLLSLGTLEWLAFGLLFHWAGFIDNNLQDYKYDVKDQNKGMFPLGREISYETASRFALVLHLLGFAYAAFLVWGSPSPVPAFFIFVAQYAFGLLYNRTNKTSPFAGIWIALCFGPLGLFSYYATVGSNPTPLVLALTVFGFLQVYFQNAVSGSMKDIDSDEYNIFKQMGVKVDGFTDPQLVVTARAFAFAVCVKAAGIVPLIALVWLTGVPPLAFLSALLFPLALEFTFQMMHNQPWDNRKTVRRAALIEISTFYAGVTALVGAIGAYGVVFVIVFSLGWFVLFNKLTWGTSLTPRV